MDDLVRSARRHETSGLFVGTGELGSLTSRRVPPLGLVGRRASTGGADVVVAVGPPLRNPRRARPTSPSSTRGAEVVITVCDRAREEPEPDRSTGRRSTPDPVAVDRPGACDATIDEFDRRIEAFVQVVP